MNGYSAIAATLWFCASFIALGYFQRVRIRAGPFSRHRAIRGLTMRIPFISRVYVRTNRRAQSQSCLADTPMMLDIVTLGLSAGLSFDAALELYCMRLDTELARQLEQAQLSWRIGLKERSVALEELADKLDVSALRSFASVVSEALAFGTPLASALEGQAGIIREEQRLELEEKIERVPVKMLIPLGTLIVPAMLLAILGPLLGPALQIG